MKRYPSWIPILRRSLLALAVLATVVAAAWVEEDMRGERELRRFEQKCRDEGEPLDYMFYRPAPVPDAQNLFQAPILAQFAKDSDASAVAKYQKENPLPLDLMRILGHWQRAERTDFAAVFAILKKTPQPGSGPEARQAAQLVLDSLRGVQAGVDRLCDAARERPYSQIEFRADGYMGSGFRTLRYFTQALTLRAAAEVELGRYDDAYRDIYTSMRLVEGAATFPSHLHLQIANVMEMFSLQPFWEGFVKGAWTDSQLGTIQDLMSRLHPLRALPAALAAVRASSVPYFESDVVRPRWMPAGWWKLNIARFFQPGSGGGWNPSSYDAAAERINLRAIGQADAQSEALRHSYSPTLWLARRYAWPHQIAVVVGFLQNSLTLGRTACALQRYRLAHGRYPESLSGLVPGLLPSVPNDVVDGEPLRYACADGAHFKLYSIGLNGIDDHGALPGKLGPTQMSLAWASTEGDWVWPQAPVN
jgi:hypothetical protein